MLSIIVNVICHGIKKCEETKFDIYLSFNEILLQISYEEVKICL